MILSPSTSINPKPPPFKRPSLGEGQGQHAPNMCVQANAPSHSFSLVESFANLPILFREHKILVFKNTLALCDCLLLTLM